MGRHYRGGEATGARVGLVVMDIAGHRVGGGGNGNVKAIYGECDGKLGEAVVCGAWYKVLVMQCSTPIESGIA